MNATVYEVDRIEDPRSDLVINPYCDTFWRRWTLARMAVAKRRWPARPRDVIAIAAALSCR